MSGALLSTAMGALARSSGRQLEWIPAFAGMTLRASAKAVIPAKAGIYSGWPLHDALTGASPCS